MGIIRQADLIAGSLALKLQNGALDIFFKIINEIFSPLALTVYAIFIAYLLTRTKSRHNLKPALFVFISTSAGVPIWIFLKYLSARTGPDIESDYGGFPSISAAVAAAFFFSIAGIQDRFKKLYIIYIFLIALAGIGLIYLGTNWLSDILLGYLLGALWAILIWYILKRSKLFL
jgi:undecaprenyl-diphosphatase